MVSTESPAVARRRLRLALRRAREAQGFTQLHIAEALDWSLSKVNRIESGDVTVSPTDLRALLRLLDVTDRNIVETLVEDARASRRRGWWDEPANREHLTPAMIQLAQFEAEATAIRYFQPSLIPGILQTRRYAEAIFEYFSFDLDAASRAARIDFRLVRAGQILDRPDPPQFLCILDESVLLRTLGGRHVMVEQLERLIELCDQPDVTVRIAPLAESAMAVVGAFIILDFGDEDNAVLYQETGLGDELAHAAAKVMIYREKFETLWEQALDRDASKRLIKFRAAEVLSSLDRDLGPYAVNDR